MKTKATSISCEVQRTQTVNQALVSVAARAFMALVQPLGLLGPKDKMTTKAAKALACHFRGHCGIAKLTRLDMKALRIMATKKSPLSRIFYPRPPCTAATCSAPCRRDLLRPAPPRPASPRAATLRCAPARPPPSRPFFPLYCTGDSRDGRGGNGHDGRGDGVVPPVVTASATPLTLLTASLFECGDGAAPADWTSTRSALLYAAASVQKKLTSVGCCLLEEKFPARGIKATEKKGIAKSSRFKYKTKPCLWMLNVAGCIVGGRIMEGILMSGYAIQMLL
nr:uncharacterized protein LOC120969771 [Aegilops tauschii subsp. strangulata]